MPFQACTIIARNYLAHARVLYRSFRQFHPEAPFSVLVFDAPRGTVKEPFDVFALQDIGLPPGEETLMPVVYNVTELATALKPWFFRHLLTRQKMELLYFDPDIEIFSSVEPIAERASQHCLVMTPHTTRPMSRNGVKPNETDILSTGAYNLGFLGLNSACDEFLDWWSERLRREATIDPANMRFTDQRWMDFAPGYFDTFILKDETCNVAYWNADSRPLTWTGERYEVRGQPLCFFHFSGFKPQVPFLLSTHQGTNPRTRLSLYPGLRRLCHEYATRLYAAGYEKVQKIPYGFNTTAEGLKLTESVLIAYREALKKHEERGTPAPPSPFVRSGEFIEWLNEPLKPHFCPEITRYFWTIYNMRPDLRAAFPNLLGVDNTAYYEWLFTTGRREMEIPDELFPPPAPWKRPKGSGRNGTSTLEPGVNLVGYFRAELGTGESGRMMVAAVKESGEKHTTQLFSLTASRQSHPWDHDAAEPDSGRYDTNLLCINADQIALFAAEAGADFFDHRYNIGLWFWEAEVFPESMHGAFAYVQEIWVTSEFVRQAIARVSPVPVLTIPHPLTLPASLPPPVSREALQLPDGFLFLFCFDFFSIFERKNPIGLIEAFKRAFAPGEGATLVIKSINGHRNLAQLEKLHYACGDRTDIIIRDDYLTAAEKQALTAACDCYVSLHRSEGFGLTLAEAMLLEKPVIATRYSGNLEFMNDANSFLCGYDLRRIGQGSDPYPSSAFWAEPRIAEAARLMRFVYENPQEARARGKQASLDVRSAHDPAIVGAFIKSRLVELRRKPPVKLSLSAHHPERALVTKVRTAIEQGVNVRATVPSLLTWLLQGPRRAMKQFLRSYDQHQRRIGLATLDAFKEIDAEWLRERSSLTDRVREQEDELHDLKEELREVLRRLAALEKTSQAKSPPFRREETVG